MCCFPRCFCLLALLLLPSRSSTWVSSPCGLPGAVPNSKRINITIGSYNGPIGIVYPDWASGRLMCELTKILLEERLGYNAIISGSASGSMSSVHTLANCKRPGSGDPGCDNPPVTSVHHITLEIWKNYILSFADVKTLQKTMAPEDLGSIGYDGIEGMYVSEAQKRRVYDSTGVALSYYMSWNVSWNNFSGFFTTYKDIDVADLRSCDDTPPMTQGSIWVNYLTYTEDTGGSELMNGVSAGRCEGGLSGHWWLAPACRMRPTECIPLITRGTGYGIATLTQQAAAYNMPVAIATARTSPGPQASTSPWLHQTLFYSWKPDPAFVNLNPQLIVFPKSDVKARLVGDFRSQIASVTLLKFTHFALGTASPRVHEMIANMHMPEDEIDGILKREAAGATITDAACQWLRSKADVWETWIADARICKAGHGIINENNTYVTDKDQAVSCEPCLRGRASNKTADGSTYACVDCPPGKVSQYMAESCVNCTAGRFKEYAGEPLCKEAPVGSYAPLPGAAQSRLCGTGSFVTTTGNSECTMCHVGEFTDVVGSTACTRCPIGKFAMSPGHSECVACSTLNTSTAGLGARSETECICDVGMYRLGTNASGDCQACPSQMFCQQGSTERSLMNFLLHEMPASSPIGNAAEPYPLLIKGFWSSRSEPFSIYKCWSEDKCPGGSPGQCAANMDLTKRSCSHCITDYYWNGEHCDLCTEAQKTIFMFPTLLILGAILVVVIMYEASRDSMERWNSWKAHLGVIGFLVFNHYQVVALLRKANAELPEILGSTVKAWRFTADINLMFNLDCAGYGEFKDLILVQSFTPIVFFGCTALVACTYWVAFKVFKIQRMALDLDRMQNVFFSVLFTYFTGIASMSMTLFNCRGNPNGDLTLTIDLNVICYESDWNGMLVTAIFAMLLYCVGMGSLFAWALLKLQLNPCLLTDLRFQMRWKFLLIRFNPEVSWWPIVFMFRGTLLNFSFVIFTLGVEQMYFFFTVEIIYLLLAFWYMPWRFRAANWCSLLIHASIIYLSTMPLLYADFDSKSRRELPYFGVSVSCLPIAVAAAVAVRIVLVEHGILAKAQDPSVMIEQLSRALLCYLESERHENGMLMACLGDWDKWHLKRSSSALQSNAILTQRAQLGQQSPLTESEGQISKSEIVRRLSERSQGSPGSHSNLGVVQAANQTQDESCQGERHVHQGDGEPSEASSSLARSFTQGSPIASEGSLEGYARRHLNPVTSGILSERHYITGFPVAAEPGSEHREKVFSECSSVIPLPYPDQCDSLVFVEI